jgi:HD superfamily phosphohydrolase YqeK
MSELEKLIFLADMLEEERNYAGVDELRALFWAEKDLDKCLAEALYQTLLFLETKGGEIYPLTKAAYDYYADKR